MGFLKTLKELLNYVLPITCVWPLFYLIRVYIDLNFIPFLLEN